jgi:hypothetical protein
MAMQMILYGMESTWKYCLLIFFLCFAPVAGSTSRIDHHVKQNVYNFWHGRSTPDAVEIIAFWSFIYLLRHLPCDDQIRHDPLLETPVHYEK